MSNSGDQSNSHENNDITENSSDEDEDNSNENNQPIHNDNSSSLNQRTTQNQRTNIIQEDTRTYGFLNRNEHVENIRFSPDIFMIILMFLAIILMMALVPLNVDNTQTNTLGTRDDVNNNTHRNFPANDDYTAHPFAYNEENIGIEVTEIIGSEAFDDRIYDIVFLIRAGIENDSNLNYDRDEENDFGSHDITNVSSSNSDESFIFKTILNLYDDNDEKSLIIDISNENNSIDDANRLSIITHITDYVSSDEDIEEISTDDGYSMKSETDLSIHDNEINVVIKIENNTDIEQPEVMASIGSNSAVKIENNTDIEQPEVMTLIYSNGVIKTENNTDIEQPEVISSIGLNGVKQSNSIDSDYVLVNIMHSTEISEDDRRIRDPLSSGEFQATTEPNHDHQYKNQQTIYDQNYDTVANNDLTGQASPNSETISNNNQNTAQAPEANSTHESTGPQNQSPVQTLQVIQTAVNGNSVKDEETACSTDSMGLVIHKQSTSPINPDEEPSPQNI